MENRVHLSIRCARLANRSPKRFGKSIFPLSFLGIVFGLPGDEETGLPPGSGILSVMASLVPAIPT
jgi:hypothetical protein